MDMSSEFGTDNHQWMKGIYENIMDKGIVKQNGQFISKKRVECLHLKGITTLLLLL